ncbi:MAG: GtrA family protein [Defluviitaleaceae bacterium]|nr:GtrA family protein [Defluviitaleaceae bacterium]
MLKVTDIKQFIRFSTVGVVNTLVFYAVYLAMLWVGFFYVAAATVGTIAGIANSYILNKRFTFRANSNPKDMHVGEKFRFTVVCVVQYLINLAVIFICISFVGLPAELAGLPAVGISMFVGYFGHRFWTFRS